MEEKLDENEALLDTFGTEPGCKSDNLSRQHTILSRQAATLFRDSSSIKADAVSCWNTVFNILLGYSKVNTKYVFLKPLVN